MEMKGKRERESAPTPNNTPRQSAPIQAQQQQQQQQQQSKKGSPSSALSLSPSPSPALSLSPQKQQQQGQKQPQKQKQQQQQQQKKKEEEEEEEEEEVEEIPRQIGKMGDQEKALLERLSSLAASDPTAHFPLSVQRRISALFNLQDKQTALEAQFREDLLALEAKYLGLYKPLFEKRTDIVSGKVEPTKQEYEREGENLEDELEVKLAIEDSKDQSPKGKGKGKKAGQIAAPVQEEKPKTPQIKGIPEFWLTCLQTHPLISETIQEHDIELLQHLTDIQIKYGEDNHSFILEFFFSPNPFFTNNVLAKTYHIQNLVGSEYEDVIFSHSEGCSIDWKQGKNVTVKVETKKQKNKANKKTRVVKKEVPQDSFFNFFSPPKSPEDGDDIDEEDEEAAMIADKIEMDFEIGEIIKAKIIPHAIDWFTGRALEYEDAFYDDEDGDDYEGDEFGESDDEDDDDDDDIPPSGRKALPSNEKPAECAQQ